MFAFVVTLALVVGIVSGGKLSRLADIRLQRFWWIAGSFLLKFTSKFFLTGKFAPSPAICTVMSVTTYLMLFYGLYPNLRLPGFWMLTSGVFLNFVVIVANQGRMPVQLAGLGPELLQKQIDKLAVSLTHQPVTNSVRLGFLADIFGSRLFSKPSTFFSIGDVLMAAGISWLLFYVLHRGFPDCENDAKIN